MKRERQILFYWLHFMRTYFKAYMLFAAIFMLLAQNVFVAHAESGTASAANEIKAVAARVNGVPIEMEAVTKQSAGKMHEYKKYGIEQSGGELAKHMRMQALEKLISVELIYQEAKKLKIDDLENRITESLAKLKNDKKAVGMEEQELREFVTKQIIVNEYLVQNKLKDPEVPESEVIKYYNENKEAFRTEERVRTRHILAIVDKDTNPENPDLIGGIPKDMLKVIPGKDVKGGEAKDPNKSKPEAKSGDIKDEKAAYKKIVEAQKLLQDGKSFAEVAKDYSQCNSAQNGGDLGYHERGYMPKAYDEVAFSLEPEKLSDIIKTEYGYHILEVIDHKPAGIQPYDEVKEFIAKYLNMNLRKKVMEEHLAALRKKAKIDIFL